ncbi:hypothetical protein [Methanolobus psychrotolerans]|uniref:hypothetical protein n=1 Tax=Methanolobus psychrotolerans TaxID=1874706 RepID=UPI000B91C0DB|nr:hypothetical protein [Methanolobus psychrotolerans]
MIPSLRRIKKDERAADALPMRMVVAAISIGTLLLLLSTGIYSLMEKEEIYAAQAVISKIESHADQMASMGAGSNVTLDIDIPSNTNLVMGAIPGKENEWPSDAHNYYLEINGKQITEESVAYYSNDTLDGCVVLSPGPHIIILKSVRDKNGKIFITLDDKSQL